MLEERTGTPGQNPEAGTMERGSWLVPACPAFLYSPGSLAHGMVLPTVVWILLQQLPIKANPHRCVHRPLWSGQFLHQGFSSQRTFSCVKLSILIMYYLCSWFCDEIPDKSNLKKERVLNLVKLMNFLRLVSFVYHLSLRSFLHFLFLTFSFMLPLSCVWAPSVVPITPLWISSVRWLSSLIGPHSPKFQNPLWADWSHSIVLYYISDWHLFAFCCG